MQRVKEMNQKVRDKKDENLRKVEMVREAKRQGKHLTLLDKKPSRTKEKEREAREKAGGKESVSGSSRPGFEGSKSKFLNSPMGRHKKSKKR